jgi:hypothetical protein
MNKVAALLLALGVNACGGAAQPVAQESPDDLFDYLRAYQLSNPGGSIIYNIQGTENGPVCTYTYDNDLDDLDSSNDLHFMVSSDGPSSSLSVGDVELPPYDACTPEQQGQWHAARMSFRQAMDYYGWVLFLIDVCSGNHE